MIDIKITNGWPYEANLGSNIGASIGSIHTELVKACEEKAAEAGKLDEYKEASKRYLGYVGNAGARAVLSLARVGVNVDALESLFLLGEQEGAARVKAIVDGIGSPLSSGYANRVTLEELMQAFPGPDRIVFPSPALEAIRPAGISQEELVDEMKKLGHATSAHLDGQAVDILIGPTTKTVAKP